MSTSFIFSETALVPFVDHKRKDPFGTQWYPVEKFIEIANVDIGSSKEDRCPWWNAPNGVYILYGNKGSDRIARPDEAKWTTLLTSDEYELIEAPNHLVLGYLVTDGPKVHYAKTFVRRKGILRLMMNKFSSKCHPYWFPHDVSPTAAPAWWSVWGKKIDPDFDFMDQDEEYKQAYYGLMNCTNNI